MNGLQATWYINGIPVYSLNPDPLRTEWQDESLGEVVHYKGSNHGGAFHSNGFSPERLEERVRVHESDHLALRALRHQSVAWVRVSDNEERTVVLFDYQGRREKGKCWYQGTISLVDV